MNMKPHHFPVAIALASMLASYFIVGLVAFWLFAPYRTLEIYNYKSAGLVQTDKDTYTLGEPIGYVLNYCKFTDVKPVISRTLVDGQEITLTDNAGYLATGCHTALLKTAIIPETINPGKYYLDVTAQYRVNPIRTMTVHYRTNMFEVARK